MKRTVFLDWLRVAACFMVMVIHATEPYYIGDESHLCIASAADACWVALIEAICRCCVPLFVMTSAYLLFPVERSTGDFFRRRCRRIVVPFAIWAVIYALVYGENPLHLAFNFPDAGGHLWFVPMLMGLYLVMPLLSPWARQVTRGELRGWIALWFVTTLLPFARCVWAWLFGDPSFGVTPFIWGEAPWNLYGAFYGVSGFLGYLLLGLYVRRFASDLTLRQVLRRAVPLWVIGTAGIAFGTLWRFGGRFPTDLPYSATVRSELFLEYCSTFVALSVVAVFLLFTRLTAEGAFYRRVIRPLSEASYGTYLVHLMVLMTLTPYFKGALPMPLAILALAAVSFAIASSVAVLGCRLPFVGRWLFG